MGEQPQRAGTVAGAVVRTTRAARPGQWPRLRDPRPASSALLDGLVPEQRRPDDSWWLTAACKDRDTELFFPEGRGRRSRVQEAAAKAVCEACPVQRRCLEAAVVLGERYGIWGGLTERERGW
jgi:WhiB family redox-sensing transcriptional regulator